MSYGKSAGPRDGAATRETASQNTDPGSEVEALTAVIESLDQIIIECDAEGAFRNVWARNEADLAMPKADHYGKRIHDVVGDEAGATVSAQYREAIETRKSHVSEEFGIVNGQRRWFETHIAPIVKPGDLCDSVAVFVRDVTPLREAQEALRASENRFSLLVEHMNEVVFTMEADTSLTFLNPAWEVVSGYEIATSLGKRLIDSIPAADVPGVQERLAAVSAGQASAGRFTLRYIARNGALRWLDIDIQPASQVDDASGGFFGTANDVTERLAAEQAMSEQREFFRNVIDTDPNLIFVKDGEGVYRLANRALADCYGTTVDDIVGKTDGDFCATEEQVAGYRLADRQVLNGSHERFIAEEQVLDAEGKTRWVQTVKRPINVPASDAPHVLGICTDITARKAFEQQLSHDAFHDPLTGLANRALFMERLRHALSRTSRQHSPLAVVFLDLDNFKTINDSLGHEAGDALLKNVAACLRTCVRQGDTVARLGGDEFTALIEDLQDESEAMGIVERFASVLRTPIVINGREIITSASIGIAVNHDQNTSADDFLRDADTAMYEAKASGKAHSVVFDLSMNARAAERLEIEISMRKAIEAGEFTLYYQPIIRLGGGQVCEVEALVRWDHPTLGSIPPNRFIPIAEQTGLIVPLGKWILEEACRRMKRLHDEHPSDSPLTVSVNLSTVQLYQTDIVSQVSEALAMTGLEARYLKLEITETVMMNDHDRTIPVLRSLESLGVRIAVDDFGTGYSSLGYLSSLPLDTIKIDRTFVDRMDNSPADFAIVQAIVTLAKTLNLAITCEGVETEVQLDHLRALGCDLAQGYYITRPLSSENLECYINASNERELARPAA